MFKTDNGAVHVLNNRTMGGPVEGVCCFMDLNDNLRRSCGELMGKLELRAYFYLWVAAWKWDLSLDNSIKLGTYPIAVAHYRVVYDLCSAKKNS